MKDTTIIVNAKDFIKTIIEIADEQPNAIRISIGDLENMETGAIERCISFDILECGGFGCCGDFDSIREMPPEEILDIP